jgi:hypothetical protein
MKVAIYHATVPNRKNQEKVDLLRFFSQGVAVNRDTAMDIHVDRVMDADVAVIQGWITADPSPRSHLALRRSVIQHQLSRGKRVVAVDSNLFLYANTENPLHYLRYSFDSVFPDQGCYCDDRPDPTRWLSIGRDLGIGLRPWRTTGGHVLLLLQRNGGWSMANYDVQQWAVDVISRLRQHTDRDIVIRAHPGDRNASIYLDPQNPQCRISWSPRVRLSVNSDLRADLQNCWAVVNHNSSPVVASAIEGIPVFVTDHARSQARDIANTDLAQIENPQMPDRQAWIERLAMSHWKFDELRSGQTWRHMRQWV